MRRGAAGRHRVAVRTVVELVWLVLAGIWLAAAYALAGVLCSLTEATDRYSSASPSWGSRWPC